MYYDVETTDLGQAELRLLDTRSMNLFPDSVEEISTRGSKTKNQNTLSVARFPCTLNSSLVFTEVDQCRREASPVGDAREQEPGGLV